MHCKKVCKMRVKASEPMTIAGTIAAVSAIWGYVDKTPCRFMECCDEMSVSFNAKNVSALEQVLEKNVYGQHIMEDILIRALRGHLLSSDPNKALVLSFHGSQGCGKSYVSEFIAQSLFAKGMKSKYVRKFVAGVDFPDPSQNGVYREYLGNEIRNHAGQCERSLFIFEDIHKMSPGILGTITPFIDYHTNVGGIDFRKSIFVFLSNTGASLINQKTFDLWKSGKQREDIKIQDFEALIRQGSFNEEGGFHKCDTISSSLIDHYIPFLPLEEVHVRKCINDVFAKYGYHQPPVGAAEKILEEMTFMPADALMYSTSGCKRVASKVTAFLHGLKFTLF